MNETDWINAKSACDVLGVRAQTLYAYVSRHHIRAKADPLDARQSLYSRRDIEALSHQKRRPRARADVARAAIRWGDPVMPTSISEVRDGTIWFRGRSIEDCAENITLEQVAALLCGLPRVICPTTRAGISGPTPFARAMKILALETETASPILAHDAQDTAKLAGRMMSLVTNACLGQDLEGQVHVRVGTAWGLDAKTQDGLRHALVLLSDHELNPSTFAVRVCASTGASLPAALLSGMATLSGLKHGGVAALAHDALKAGLDDRFEVFLHENARQDAYTYGFGHPLYPNGDPRAVHMLARIPEKAPARCAVEKMSERLGIAPNVDAALAAFVSHHGCPRDAASTLFAIARVAGWIAHAIEQTESGTTIRPRAKYHSRPCQ